ncbi:hypothetical protein ACWGLF_22345 [Streptomyces puniciscabiei]
MHEGGGEVVDGQAVRAGEVGGDDGAGGVAARLDSTGQTTSLNHSSVGRSRTDAAVVTGSMTPSRTTIAAPSRKPVSSSSSWTSAV